MPEQQFDRAKLEKICKDFYFLKEEILELGLLPDEKYRELAPIWESMSEDLSKLQNILKKW